MNTADSFIPNEIRKKTLMTDKIINMMKDKRKIKINLKIKIEEE